MTMVDKAVYVDGLRTDNPKNLDETYEVMRERGGMAWIGLYRPGLDESTSVGDEFSLRELAVGDAVNGHRRAKLERYGDTLFNMLRRHVTWTMSKRSGSANCTSLGVRHAESPNPAKVRHRLEADPELLALGAQAVSTQPCWPSSRTRRRVTSPRRAWPRTRKSRRSPRGRPSTSPPPLVGTVYGMNFENMPELSWPLGYPFALGLMLATGIVLYL